MKRGIVLTLIICLSFWMLPAYALAEQADITVGETQASVDITAETADAQATAAYSTTTGDSLGDVSSHADAGTPNSSQSASDGPDSIEVGADTTVEFDQWETESSASYVDGAGAANSSERVQDVAINLPEEYEDQVGEIINVEIVSKGASSAVVGLGELNETGQLSYASAQHEISGVGGVDLYDSDIRFNSISVVATAYIDGNNGSHAVYRIIIVDLSVWNYTTLMYTTPVTVDTDAMTPAQIETLRISLNNALINDDYLIEITSLADATTSVSGSVDNPFANVWATGMVVHIIGPGGETVDLTFCEEEAHADLDSAEAYGKEVVLSAILPEAESEGEAEGSEQATGTVTQAAQTTGQQVSTGTSSGQDELPYTGASLELIALLGLAMMGAGIKLRRK